MKKAHSLHHQTQGAAASAAKYRGNGGLRDRSSKCCFIPGEGWIPWTELQAQVERAFAIWAQTRAMAGKFLFDAAESRQADIGIALDRKRRGIRGNHLDDAHPLR